MIRKAMKIAMILVRWPKNVPEGCKGLGINFSFHAKHQQSFCSQKIFWWSDHSSKSLHHILHKQVLHVNMTTHGNETWKKNGKKAVKRDQISNLTHHNILNSTLQVMKNVCRDCIELLFGLWNHFPPSPHANFCSLLQNK